MTIQPDFTQTNDSWAKSVTDDLERSNRRAWAVAIVASVIALLLAIALVVLLPLKTVEPYTILVDKQTGNVEALAPLDEKLIAPDAALTRSMLVQYVIARESFSQDGLQSDYRKVGLWSDDSVTRDYQAAMNASNPQSPLAYLPQRATIATEIKSVSSLANNRAMVRFTTTRKDPSIARQPAQHWVAVMGYGFSAAAMTEADRYLNPLGFQVTSYRRDAETLPEAGIVNGIERPEIEGARP
ncbi:virB8 family protein [Erythrobacter sp. THAF29]|uniref:virB8 family protein n=1 Tax=Erythrobacter sp. THAF29 TaxID=2587851 RepID=UPI0012689BF2|nr:VirB8/TrbF family protein [Erythrobacter sp. THAF29]QFT78514.1 Type IV secretion system protein virB8 [Erythrobacter sp. THAF29]